MEIRSLYVRPDHPYVIIVTDDIGALLEWMEDNFKGEHGFDTDVHSDQPGLETFVETTHNRKRWAKFYFIIREEVDRCTLKLTFG